MGQLGWGPSVWREDGGGHGPALPRHNVRRNNQCGAIHHVLENRSNEQDTDFKGTFMLLNIPSEGL